MIWQTWKMSWAAVCANKLRTFLTMLGIIIGVVALIVLVSIADGASSSVSEQISDMGSSYLTVRITDDKENPIRLGEFSTLLKDDALQAAAPYGRTSVTAKSGYTSGTMSVSGTTGSYFEIMSAMESVNDTMSLMLGGIAAISLLAGGIGIMNIMMVSVTERTKEIGIRKAIGAGRGGIMLQFLLEALMVSMMGCLAGIVLSFLILKGAGMVMEGSMSFQMDGRVAWISVLFSLLNGVIFGLYPANKAARKKPIDALRYSG